MIAPTARELLAEHARTQVRFLGPGRICGWYCVCGESGQAETRSAAIDAHRGHQADAILASPALDAIVAERIAALADDEAALNAVWDAMESHGHNGIECRPEKPMDYTAVYVIHALAAVLAERRSSDG